ncbi:hypothetical protein PM082_014565 [Marasmius tenuissimus]|nr:hypothetical protein PM082_014565 [Marasmius tenuissimus]
MDGVVEKGNFLVTGIANEPPDATPWSAQVSTHEIAERVRQMDGSDSLCFCSRLDRDWLVEERVGGSEDDD